MTEDNDDTYAQHRRYFAHAQFGAELGRWMYDKHMRMRIRDRANAFVIKATGRKHKGYPGIARNDNGPPCARCGKPCDIFIYEPSKGYICRSCDKNQPVPTRPPVKNPEAFKVTTYADSICSAFGTEERPPRTAKLVAQVSWSWSPANDRCDRYLICTDRHRRAWTLWAVWAAGDYPRMYARVASGTPFRSYPARFAAEQLLTAAWKSELENWHTDLRGGEVEREGLLTECDIRRIEQEAFGPCDDRPER